jgi:acetyltransferase-like isoleucine patch superfamily enzyme
VGEDCNICDQVFIEGNVRVGNRVTVKCGVYLWDGLIVEDDVFIGPGAAFTNDLYPRAGNKTFKLARTLLRSGCSIGANAAILAGHTIGCCALVGAGAVVTRDVPNFAVVVGNPARVVGYACVCGCKMTSLDNDSICPDCSRRFSRTPEGIRLVAVET